MDQHLKVLQQKDRPKASETFHVTQIWSMLPWRPRATILSSQNQCIQSWGVPYKLEQSMLPAHRSPPSSAPPQKERVGAEHPSLPTGTCVGAALAHMDISQPPHITTISFQVIIENNKVSPESPPDWTIPAPSAAPHKICALNSSPALLPFSGHTPEPQRLSCSEGAKTEHSTQCTASPELQRNDHFPAPSQSWALSVKSRKHSFRWMLLLKHRMGPLCEAYIRHSIMLPASVVALEWPLLAHRIKVLFCSKHQL